MSVELDSNAAQKILDGIKIPPAPFTLQQLQAELQNDEPELMKLANIIAMDVGISAMMLKTVNAPFFGLRSKVNSIMHAANLLGIKNIVNIVAGLELQRTFEENKGDSPPNFWDSPSNVALIAANLARKMSGIEPDVMYMLGLFHNAGHALMCTRFDGYLPFMVQNLNAEESIISQLEDQTYQTNHATLGYFLARSWGIDKDAAEVIRDHHRVRERLREESTDGLQLTMLAVLKIAEHIDKLYWGMDPDHEWDQIEDLVLDFLGLSKPDYNDIQIDMLEKLNWDK